MIDLSMPTAFAATTPDQTFEAIYRNHSREITTYIASRLYRTDRYLAEDLTAETFIGLWRNLTNGIAVEYPRALLRTIADRAIAAHFRRAGSHETATDFTTNPAAVTTNDTPYLSLLLAELEQAEENLTEACTAYKRVTQMYVTACAAHANAQAPEAVTRTSLRRDRAALLRQAALNDFAEAALVVARARAAWNTGAWDLHEQTPEPLPQRDPGETFRKPPATVAAPRPVPTGSPR